MAKKITNEFEALRAFLRAREGLYRATMDLMEARRTRVRIRAFGKDWVPPYAPEGAWEQYEQEMGEYGYVLSRAPDHGAIWTAPGIPGAWVVR